MVCAFASSYYDMSKWWIDYSDAHPNVELIDFALQDLKNSMSKVLSHPVMLPEPLMDLCHKFKYCEMLISQAVCHMEMVFDIFV
jgi:hypothetical protein